MKTLIRSMLLTATVILTVASPQQLPRSNAQSIQRDPPQTIELSAQIGQDPLEFSQTLTEKTTLNCDATPATANWVFSLAQPVPYLRFTIHSEGEPILIIEGPGGRFCVLADNYSGDNPEISGLWDAGTYNVYVGNRTPGDYSYTLQISQQPN
jgi:hypothetical protein